MKRMNQERSSLDYTSQDRLFEREERLKKVQTYKKKNQLHPAFKK